MAKNVITQVLGGAKRVLDGVCTVNDCRKELGLGSQYRASIDGSPADDNARVVDGNYVSFSEAVKGASRIVAGMRI
jgi:hypothetical protein